MKLDDPEVRAKYTGRLRCEFCFQHAIGGTVCAHVFSRGAGWVDLDCNCVALCASCHFQNHNGGSPKTHELLRIASKREGISINQARAAVWRIRRLDKDGNEIVRKL